ncbi:MAG: hypothetical protein CVU05_15310 [Bacteroidetes bacterium HGW-Bacteroidetes-21]|nr:MAG: hypothetical protein CVU05_15310 [Bacteroidetes bacterium HGW-Bacteroidetes-21]
MSEKKTKKEKKDKVPIVGNKPSIEILFGSFLDAIPDIIGIQDSNHNILKYNQAGYDFLQVQPEDIVGKKCYELIGKNKICDNCATEKAYKTKIPTKTIKYFEEYNIWLDIRSYPVLDDQGNIEYIIEHLRDISKQIESEKQITQTRNESREKTRFLELLISNLPGMVYRCKNDKNWTMEFIGGKCEELTGYNTFEIINNEVVSYNDLIVREYRELLWDIWQVQLKKNEPVIVEYEINTADGQRKWVWEQGRGVFDENGALQALEGFIMDISTQKQNQRILKQKNEEIYQQNEEYKQINQELFIAKGKAEESDRLKSAFLANMSHEIRTPLNGLLGFAELLGKTEMTAEKRQQYIKIINASGQQLLSIINDLIDISRIETNQVVLQETDVVISRMVRNLYEFFKPMFVSREIEFVLSELPEIMAKMDEVKVNQILTNLLSNAIKFTHKGQIEIGYRKLSDNLEFFVKDTGIGISKADTQIIFDRFRQAENTDGLLTRGTGLGLAICKGYVELMGGKIKVDSVLGKGSEFSFTIPYVSSSNKYYYEGEKATFIDLSGKTIVVAEDEDVNFLLLEIVLSEANATVLRAKNGIETIALCSKESECHIDLLIMDIKMPGMDGMKTIKEIKKMHPNLPVIGCTAYAMQGDKENILKAGYDDYIPKPIHAETLFEKIEKCLKPRQTKQQSKR